MKRLAALALSFVLGAAPAARAAPLDDWLSDFEEIKTALAERAPNLDWAIAHRGVDPAAAARETGAALRAATSEAEARRLLRAFVAQWGDGHMEIWWPDEYDEDAAEEDPAAALCADLGFVKDEFLDGLPFAAIGARIVETPASQTFPIALLDLPAGRLGVLRIATFDHWNYFGYCRQAVALAGAPAKGDCDEDCKTGVSWRAISLLTTDLAGQIARLKAEGASAIVVDITANGGGTLWADPLARMLTAKPLKAPHMLFARTEDWRADLEAELADLDEQLSNAMIRLFYGRVLGRVRATLTKAIEEARLACDRSGLWTGEKPACSLLSSEIFYATGVVDYAAPGVYGDIGSSYLTHFPSDYDYVEGLWSGPLYVLIDEGSASMSEYFAAILRDNGAATLIGEPSSGAGCGWMSNGEQYVTLSASGADLYIPDCVWTRPDGANLVGGIEPDILLPWRASDTPEQKVRRLEATLKGLSWLPGDAGAAPNENSAPR